MVRVTIMVIVMVRVTGRATMHSCRHLGGSYLSLHHRVTVLQGRRRVLCALKEGTLSVLQGCPLVMMLHVERVGIPT
jgi:hypothetical protein